MGKVVTEDMLLFSRQIEKIDLVADSIITGFQDAEQISHIKPMKKNTAI